MWKLKPEQYVCHRKRDRFTRQVLLRYPPPNLAMPCVLCPQRIGHSGDSTSFAQSFYKLQASTCLHFPKRKIQEEASEYAVTLGNLFASSTDLTFSVLTNILDLRERIIVIFDHVVVINDSRLIQNFGTGKREVHTCKHCE